MNDGPLSYKIIASYLSGFTERISAAEKVQESTGTCTPVDPKSIAHLSADDSGGLPLNGFVCYDRNLIQEEYLKCAEFSTPAPITDSAPTPSAPAPSAPTPTTTSGNVVPTSSAANSGGDFLVIMAMMMLSAVVYF